MASVRFLSTHPNFRKVIGSDGRRTKYAEFYRGVYETDDPATIALLLEQQGEHYRVDPDCPLIVCEVCGQAVKTELALMGHMKSHAKDEAPKEV